MNETKFINCEQYVLARLVKLEQENEALKAKFADREATIAHMNAIIDKQDGRYDELKNLIKQNATVKVATNGTDRYIDITTVWERYDDHYDQLVALLELEVPEINTTEEE